MKKFLARILSIGVLCISASAHAVLIDFEMQNGMNLTEGDIITGQTLSGATFNLIGQGNTGGYPGVPRELMIFNSNCGLSMTCTGGDHDLATDISPPETMTDPIFANNILIISEDNNTGNPDDSAFGGSIIVTFATDVTSVTGVTVDVGDSGSTGNKFEAYLDNVLIDTILLSTNLGDNNVQTASLSGLFDEVRLVLTGSGALASLDFTPVPLPAALPLFVAGLLGLFGMHRKAAA